MKDSLKKLICIVLMTAMVAEPMVYGPVSAYANSTTDKIKEAEKMQQDTKQQLGQTQNTLNQLKDSKRAIQNSLNNLNEQIDEKSEEISDLQDQIEEKEANIATVEKEYEDAVEQADEQYRFVKIRIRKIYESGADSIYDLLFNSSGMADFLNKAVYIAKMNDYDDKMLEKFRNLQDEAAKKKETLLSENAELQELYEEAEQEAGDLQDLADSTKNSLVSYAGAISEKEKEALEYEAKLLAGQQTIAQLKSKLKEEEELAKKAEKMEFRDLSEVSIASGDRDLLAAIIQCEAGGEPYAGKIAVGAVIMNRVRSAAFPNTIAGVVYQPMQFQPVRSGRLAIRLAEGANETCYKAADEVLAGANNIGKCLFFRTVVPGIKGTIIGHHVFYLYWTGVASGYGTVEESLEGDASESKAASEAAASKAASEAASKEAEEKEQASKEAASREAASKAAADKAASEAAASKAASEAAASKAASEEASRKASEDASKKASEAEASGKASEEAATSSSGSGTASGNSAEDKAAGQ